MWSTLQGVAQGNIVEAPKGVVGKVRDPVPDEQLLKLKETLARSQAAQLAYSTYTQEQV